MASSRKVSIAILISGRGSNMEAIIEATKSESYPAAVKVVISDNAQAEGLEIAKIQGITTQCFEQPTGMRNREHEKHIEKIIDNSDAELICLAGYMRLLSSTFVNKYKGRLINIHPSLLPKYKGLNTHHRALEDGESLHGCTVHFVNSEMDSGEIIAQTKVPVLTDDTISTLSQRVLDEEHKLYPKVIKTLAIEINQRKLQAVKISDSVSSTNKKIKEFA